MGDDTTDNRPIRADEGRIEMLRSGGAVSKEELERSKKNAEIGLRIRQWREKAGMRTEELANYLQVNKGYVSNIETGNKGMSMEVLTRLAILGADLNMILANKPFMNSVGHCIDDETYNVAH